MGSLPQQHLPGSPAPSFRLDVHLHELLRPTAEPIRPSAPPEGMTLPHPAFPQRPDLVSEKSPDEVIAEPHMPPVKRQYSRETIQRTLRGWLYPYVKSRVLPGDFHPIIAYLFTEWKCNLDCHYCWAFDNTVKGMTEDTARRAIDWLHSTTCRVLALMGGEPLLRPDFVHRVVYYAAKKGFWVYLPTNARLLRPEVIDRLADAGVATVNFAVDVVDEKPGLPKALNPVRRYFEYLVRRQYDYGYSLFFNINICRTNLEDVKRLTEIARANRIATDYHINESPMLEQAHFQHYDDNSTFIRPEDWPAVDELIHWLKEKNMAGYKMVNSVQRLEDMKGFMRGKLQDWSCRAGQNNVIIRVDGSLAPCFPMYSATYNWGKVGAHKFEVSQLNEMKKGCQPHCFSTLNHNLAYCYDAGRVIKWVLRQAVRGFQGTTGSFD
ncbi:MAG TPA: radical SAM protein [Candidatus Acidoferrales bacterium]|nr:radical SAM protein [Candidatus Acidoferrales bacterium]